MRCLLVRLGVVFGAFRDINNLDYSDRRNSPADGGDALGHTLIKLGAAGTTLG